MLKYQNFQFILAFDHRASLIKMFGEDGGIFENKKVDFRALKQVIFDALLHSIKVLNLSPADVGILVDEEYGSQIAHQAKQMGITLAMPAERSMQNVFELEYGDEFDKHIEAFNPDQIKILAIRNDSFSKDDIALTISRVKQLSDWIKPRPYKFMIELLVFPTVEQLALVNNSQERFDLEIRPKLMVDTIKKYQEAGIEADLWKVEGLKDIQQYQAVANQATSGGRENVECIILGRAALDNIIEEWVSKAAKISAFTGFAIGRSTWAESLTAFMKGQISRDEAIQQISDRFATYVGYYLKGRNL